MQHLLRYTQALFTPDGADGSPAIGSHLDQQFCRWLLLTLDRSHHQRVVDDSGEVADDARCAAGRRDGCARPAAEIGADPLRARTYHLLGRAGLEDRAASAMGS